MNRVKLTPEEMVEAARQSIDLFTKDALDKLYALEKPKYKYAKQKVLALNIICLN